MSMNVIQALPKRISSTVFVLLLATLSACAEKQEDKDTTLQQSIDKVAHNALFNPAQGNIPFPNNILFSGSTDGTVNMPVDDETDYADPKVALNSLDGFSTIAPFSASFSTGINPATITSTSVRVYEVTLSAPAGAVVAINRQLEFASDFLVSVSAVDSAGTTLLISPLHPLDAQASYLVVISKELQASDGKPFLTDVSYALCKSDTPLVDEQGISRIGALNNEQAAALEPIRLLTTAAEATVSAYDENLNADDIVLSWTFTTQSVADVLTEVKTIIDGTSITSSINSTAVPVSTVANASIHTGSLKVPYFLATPTSSNPEAPLNNFWTTAEGGFLTAAQAIPGKTIDIDIPVLISIPDSGTGPWPVVIFTHGNTANRTALLAIADDLAVFGFAGVAIDLPLHGISRDATDGTTVFRSDNERHFGLDLIGNTTTLPGADGIIDPPGIHFINLHNLVVTRDNLRQAIADLFSLTKALGTMDVDNDTIADFDPGNIYFLGHSIGGIAGANFLALEGNVKSAVLAMTGGGLTRLLDGSATYGPIMSTLLGLSGTIKGTLDYENYLNLAQTVVDAADPINYASLTGTGRGILLMDVVGGNTSSADLVLPVSVPDNNSIAATQPAPLSGSTPLATHMGLTQVKSSFSGTNLSAWTRFNAGHHSSLLSPLNDSGQWDAVSAQVTDEMRTQAFSFLSSNGSTLTITDTTVIAAP